MEEDVIMTRMIRVMIRVMMIRVRSLGTSGQAASWPEGIRADEASGGSTRIMV